MAWIQQTHRHISLTTNSPNVRANWRTHQEICLRFMHSHTIFIESTETIRNSNYHDFVTFFHIIDTAFFPTCKSIHRGFIRWHRLFRDYIKFILFMCSNESMTFQGISAIWFICLRNFFPSFFVQNFSISQIHNHIH